MTFSVVARCKVTGKIGIGITTASPHVGARCIFAAAGVGAIALQAVCEPRLGQLGLDLLKMGFSAPKVLAELMDTDPGAEWRQIGIVDAQGRIAANTGENNKIYAGHVIGDGFVSLGNTVDSEEVPAAMAKAFESGRGEELEERLMRALEAGRDAGGQGELGTTSSALLVFDKLPFAYVNLRVDLSTEAVGEMRRTLDWHKPFFEYYLERANNYKIGFYQTWAKERGIDRQYGIPQPKKS